MAASVGSGSKKSYSDITDMWYRALEKKASESGLKISSFEGSTFYDVSVLFEVTQGRYTGYYVSKSLRSAIDSKIIGVSWKDLSPQEQGRYLADLQDILDIDMLSEYVGWDGDIRYRPRNPKDEVYEGLTYSSTLGNLWKRTSTTVQDPRSLEESSKRILCKRVFETEGYKIKSYPDVVTLKAKVELESPNGHSWSTTISKFYYRNQRCPKERYRRSTGEAIVHGILKENKVEFYEQYPIEVRDYTEKNRRLLFDFYLPKHNLVIEYNGEQHYRPFDNFGGLEAYKQGTYRDSLKADWCSDNKVNLLIIPYTIDTIEDVGEYINTYLSTYGCASLSLSDISIKRVFRNKVLDEAEVIKLSLDTSVTHAANKLEISTNTIRRIMSRHNYKFKGTKWAKEEEIC